MSKEDVLKAFEQAEKDCDLRLDTSKGEVRTFVYGLVFEGYKAARGVRDVLNPEHLTESERDFVDIAMPYLHGGIEAARKAFELNKK